MKVLCMMRFVSIVGTIILACSGWADLQAQTSGTDSAVYPIELRTSIKAKQPESVVPLGAESKVLYDQMDNAATTGITSQDYEPIYDDFDSEAADDFVIVPGEEWAITEVEVLGIYTSGGGPVDAFHVSIYESDGTLPGTLAASRSSSAYSQTGDVFTISLVPPVNLSDGHYWVSVQADMGVEDYGQWYWTERTIQSEKASAWRNPGGAYGVGCTTWGARSFTCNVGSEDDLTFRLLGNEDCVNFESLPLGLQLGGCTGNSPGDVIFSENDIQVSLQNYHECSGGVYFECSTVEWGWDGNFINIDNLNYKFDFTGLDFEPNQVTFEIENNETCINIAINTEPIFSGNIADYSPDCGEFSISSSGDYWTATLNCCDGIDSLIIGGQELRLDNICALDTVCHPIPPISTGIVPEDSVVLIPPEGGSFRFTVSFENNTGSNQSFNAWTMLVRPDSITAGPQLGPARVSILPFGTKSKVLTQSIPGGAQPGEYRYILYSGIYPDSVYHSDEMTFEKLATEVAPGALGESASSLPHNYKLEQNYPNPFNPSTVIRYQIPARSNVRLVVYDMLGTEVRELVSGSIGFGFHEVIWDGTNAAGEKVASGIYLYRLSAGTFVQTHKMLLAR